MKPKSYRLVGWGVAVGGIGLVVVQAALDAMRQPAAPEKMLARAEAKRQVTTASVSHLFVTTSVDIAYESPVGIDNSVTIRAKLSQENLAATLPTAGRISTDPPERQAFARLQWPVEISIKSAGFDFAAGENSKTFPAATPLPAEAVWAPVAKKPGRWDLLLRIDNISGGEQSITRFPSPPDAYPVILNLNGRITELKVGSDLVLPVEIEPERFLGIIPDPIDKLLMLILFPLIGFVIGSDFLRGVIARQWQRIRS